MTEYVWYDPLNNEIITNKLDEKFDWYVRILSPYIIFLGKL